MIRLNVAPLILDHAEETAEDLRRMFKENIIDSTVFSCAFCPEGNPAIDKGAEFARRFAIYKELLKGSGLPAGILIQSSMGHGWLPTVPTPFRTIVKIDGSTQYTFCPEDQDFRSYIVDAIVKCAKEGPDFFMLDDDTRLITGRKACFCPLHIQRFNAQFGTAFTSEELREAVQTDRTIADQYLEMLRGSMSDYAQLIRDAIDSVNPELSCSFCQCSLDTYATPDMARILAGKGHAPMVRLNNGIYMKDTARIFPHWLMRTAEQLNTLPENLTVLAEPDTCPQNRYATSATFMRTHLTLSMMEGCKGGKLWITRMALFEPLSGKLYRKALKEDAGLMEYACNSVIDWHGPQIPFSRKPVNTLFAKDVIPMGWHEPFARLGLPFAFSRGVRPGFVTLLSEREITQCTDDELKTAFSGKVLLDGPGALALTRRGLGDYCGCTVAEWKKDNVTGEDWNGRPQVVSLQSHIVDLTPGPAATSLSTLLYKTFAFDNTPQPVGVAAAIATNSLGGTVITLAQQCLTWEGFSTAYGTLTVSRKEQFIDFLNMLSPMELYTDGDCDALFKYGIDQDGRKVAELLNISLDPMEDIVLKGTWISSARPQILQQDGTWKDADFSIDHDKLTIRATVLPSRVIIFSL